MHFLVVLAAVTEKEQKPLLVPDRSGVATPGCQLLSATHRDGLLFQVKLAPLVATPQLRGHVMQHQGPGQDGKACLLESQVSRVINLEMACIFPEVALTAKRFMGRNDMNLRGNGDENHHNMHLISR